jgi:Protein of unknown function (DUF3575)
MKKIFLLFGLSLLMQQGVIAQKFDGNLGSKPTENYFRKYQGDADLEDNNGKESGSGRNIFKINLMSLPYSNYSVQYERIILEKVSLALGLRYMPATNLPLGDALKDVLKNTDASAANTLLNTKLDNYAITPEAKFYLSKQAGKGFYVSLMGRYEKFNLISPFNILLNSGKKIDALLLGTKEGFGGGAMLGTQFAFGKHITLDWWIGGVYIGPQTYKLSAESATFKLSPSEITQIQDALTITNFWLETTTDVTPSKISISSSNSLTPSVRTGLCIGVRF